MVIDCGDGKFDVVVCEVFQGVLWYEFMLYVQNLVFCFVEQCFWIVWWGDNGIGVWYVGYQVGGGMYGVD